MTETGRIARCDCAGNDFFSLATPKPSVLRFVVICRASA